MTGKPDPRTHQIPRLRKRCDLLAWTPNTVMAWPVSWHQCLYKGPTPNCPRGFSPTWPHCCCVLSLCPPLWTSHRVSFHPFFWPCPLPLQLDSTLQLCSKAVMQSSESSSFLQVASLGSFLYPCGLCLHLYLSTSGTSWNPTTALLTLCVHSAAPAPHTEIYSMMCDLS